MPRRDGVGGAMSAQAQQDLVSDSIDNFELPKSLVTKIAKSAMPENAKLQKETVLSLVKGSTVFINYLAATAHDVASSKQHKSISASDVLKALEMIEFGDLVENLQNELQIYRENTKGDKNRKSATASSSHTGNNKSGETESVPIVSKSKGKEKATNLPPPFTFAPLAAAASSASQAELLDSGVAQEVDEDMGEAGEGDEEEEYVEELEDEGVEEGEEEVRNASMEQSWVKIKQVMAQSNEPQGAMTL